VLDGHALMLQLSHNTKKSGDSDSRASAVKKVDKKESSTKIIVRNVAFEATRKDLQQLFNPFGQVNIQLLACSAMLHRNIFQILFSTYLEPGYN
jgi:multiple RNA-binding domain-containing protein 1